MTTETNETISGTGIPEPVIKDPIPAPGAEEQKPTPPAGEESAETAAETTEQQEARKQSKFQRRLQRQRDARIAAETELRLEREKNAKLEAALNAPKETGEPKREQFEDYETYLEKRAEWLADRKVSERLKAEREVIQGRERQRDAVQSQEKVAKAWTERETAFQATTKDYTETVTPFVEEDLGHLSDGARRAIVESEVGPQLLYHLAQNPEEAERIADLSPVRQVAELGKLEVTLKPVGGKKVTSAPAPITPVAQGTNAPKGYSENMTDAEYKAWRKQHGARWAR